MPQSLKVGRNSPCPCGSGKKFKKCCSTADYVAPSSNRGPQHFTLKGKAAEGVIQELAEGTFFTDWCYPNPKLPDGKELCDLLVVFGKTAIIWQIKDLEPNKDGFLREPEIEKNLRQLSGARRQIQDLKTRVELTNPRRGTEVLDTARIQTVFLISVILAPTDRGEVQPFRFVEDVKGRLAHVFYRDFTEIILNELDTIDDFCKFLSDLEVAATSCSFLLLSGEEELLAQYLAHGRSFMWADQKEMNVVHEGAWSALQQNENYKTSKVAIRSSYVWDGLIDSAHEGGSRQPRYELVARELASHCRAERRILAEQLLEAYKMAREQTNLNVFRRIAILGSRTYCFLFMRNPIQEIVLTKLLEGSCLVARGKFQENSKVIGIAARTELPLGSYFHFGMLEITTWNQEHEEKMRGLQKEFGILTGGSSRTIDY